ncbi:MAG: helix-turn-helix transcriptional regulator [Deltaproteobacteria bacterium]|nr:helix-turn-helix transcriptional regulator [Deltaproteobacteria bacterium]
MNVQTLTIICKLKHLSQSDISRMAGVSRQAVSLWFKPPQMTNIKSNHLESLSRALDVSADSLLKPVAHDKNSQAWKRMNVLLLWDKLYPSLEDFVIALIRSENRALARLVETYGLYTAHNLIGSIVWNKFQKYKKYLPKVRQHQCEQLWNLHKSQK